MSQLMQVTAKNITDNTPGTAKQRKDSKVSKIQKQQIKDRKSYRVIFDCGDGWRCRRKISGQNFQRFLDVDHFLRSEGN